MERRRRQQRQLRHWLHGELQRRERCADGLHVERRTVQHQRAAAFTNAFAFTDSDANAFAYGNTDTQSIAFTDASAGQWLRLRSLR